MTIDTERNRPPCLLCGLGAKQKGLSKLGFMKYSKYCSNHHKQIYSDAHRFQLRKQDKCSRCGFVPEHSCQLDVDHINGVHSDNRKENLQTLCANCHRLKTLQNKEGMYKEKALYF